MEAVERVMPSIVNIRTETVVERNNPSERFLQEFWSPFYRRRGPETTVSLGSGVIIDEEGWVLTNFHVVGRATRIYVRLSDGREMEAEAVVGTSFTDVALLRLKAPTNSAKFKAIAFAREDDLLLGETVLALGNPFGLGGSVSRGILSSKSRRPPADLGTGADVPLEVEDWLQTDAAVNPGNSGGPLVNLRGELIGINVAVHREGQGISFAIPVKRLVLALGEIYSPENLGSLWFGARLKPGSSPLTIGAVQVESPAAKGGLFAGDRILLLNGSAPRGFIDFARELVKAGTTRDVQLVVERGTERRTATLRLVPEAAFFNVELIRKRTGMTVENLTLEHVQMLGLDSTNGVVIGAVERNAPAARGGLERNMILTGIDGQRIESYVRLAKVLHGKAKGEEAVVNLIAPRLRGRFIEKPAGRAALTLR